MKPQPSSPRTRREIVARKREPAIRGLHVTDFYSPDQVWVFDCELAIESVRRHGSPVIRLGGGPAFPHSLGTDALCAHEPGSAMLAGPIPSLHERLPGVWTPAGLATLQTDHSDVRHARPNHDNILTMSLSISELRMKWLRIWRRPLKKLSALRPFSQRRSAICSVLRS